MKKNKEKEKDTNPYHKEYGVFSNSIHALKSMLSYSHRFIPVIIISVVCAPIMQYLWSFISKFVIDMITSGQSVTALALLMGGFTVIQITATMLNLYGNSFYHNYIGARFRQMGLKNRKIMSVDYGYLEDKDFMDCYQKAGNACNSNNGYRGNDERHCASSHAYTDNRCRYRYSRYDEYFYRYCYTYLLCNAIFCHKQDKRLC